MRGWWQEITGLVLPVACAGCGRPRAVLCDACTRTLHGRKPVRVRPEPEPAGLPAVRAAAPYADAVRAALLAHKERGALALATPLGAALAGAVRAAATGGAAAGGAAAGGGAGAGGVGEGVGVGARPLVLVPVPSARRAVRARGHDAVRRVAMAAARELRRGGAAVRAAPVLRQRRAVADQAGLDARQRQENMAGALEVLPGGARLLAGGRVVLVDDLMTTGASLAEAARALYAAGVVRASDATGKAGVVGVTGATGEAGVVTVSGATGEAGMVRAIGAMDEAGLGRVPGVTDAMGVVGASGATGAGNGGDSRGVPGTFGGPGVTFGPGRGELPQGDHGAVLIGAAVVAASPKAFGINRN